jgi:hypothetical protein
LLTRVRVLRHIFVLVLVLVLVLLMRVRVVLFRVLIRVLVHKWSGLLEAQL